MLKQQIRILFLRSWSGIRWPGKGWHIFQTDAYQRYGQCSRRRSGSTSTQNIAVADYQLAGAAGAGDAGAVVAGGIASGALGAGELGAGELGAGAVVVGAVSAGGVLELLSLLLSLQPARPSPARLSAAIEVIRNLFMALLLLVAAVTIHKMEVWCRPSDIKPPAQQKVRSTSFTLRNTRVISPLVSSPLSSPHKLPAHTRVLANDVRQQIA